MQVLFVKPSQGKKVMFLRSTFEPTGSFTHLKLSLAILNTPYIGSPGASFPLSTYTQIFAQ